MREASSLRMPGEIEKAEEKLLGEIREGLRHGFFDYSVSCEIVTGRMRRLTIKAGKSHQFTIPEDEVLALP